MFEQIPTYGTSILSIISGFLFSEKSITKSNFLSKKIKTLLIPFIISNIIVIALILLVKYLGYNYINRLAFDVSLLTEGLFSLSSEPVNPPTYFIRDIFLLFCVISLFRKNFYALIFILPYLCFGELFLRKDVILLFIIGWNISIYRKYLCTNRLILLTTVILMAIVSYYSQINIALKVFISIFIFILFFDKKINFFKVGGYSYLLHLYHAPIIVIIYPILSIYLSHQLSLVLLQFLITIIIIFIFYVFLKKSNIKVFTGGRL